MARSNILRPTAPTTGWLMRKLDNMAAETGKMRRTRMDMKVEGSERRIRIVSSKFPMRSWEEWANIRKIW
ncbi:hypothetical protein HPP92_023682 [Vanilla planifolia]|uniref:Uncharacterized protein n=1 Tax=Vanilla planifolia TaxID=51239 RepID=A0A835PQT6_VANPL|nr:hypothetical protein HPP92_023682 [Vanilla planifolia]